MAIIKRYIKKNRQKKVCYQAQIYAKGFRLKCNWSIAKNCFYHLDFFCYARVKIDKDNAFLQSIKNELYSFAASIAF